MTTGVLVYTNIQKGMVNMGWQCANDDGHGAEIPEPTASYQIGRKTEYFAQGQFDAIFAKDEITGGYLWGHLHGIHNDRQGETTYNVTVDVATPSGKRLILADTLTTTVEGVLDKPRRHRHCYGVFEPEGKYEEQLKKAIELNLELQIRIVAHRDRASFTEWFSSQVIGPVTDEMRDAFKKFVEGQIGSEAILDILNEGLE